MNDVVLDCTMWVMTSSRSLLNGKNTGRSDSVLAAQRGKGKLVPPKGEKKVDEDGARLTCTRLEQFTH
jgi:hypothetical protein